MILAYVEYTVDGIEKSSQEALTAAGALAREMNGGLEAVLVGESASSSAQMASFGVQTVHQIVHSRLDAYAPKAYASGIRKVLSKVEPLVLIGPGSEKGNEVLAHVAAEMDIAFSANCIEIHPGDPFTVVRQRWGGSLLEEATVSGSPLILSLAPHAIQAEGADTTTEPALEIVTPEFGETDFRVMLQEETSSKEEGVSLADARIVVGGGRGVGSEEGFATLEQLANLLGGAVGSSRAATNLGWRSHADQIGQTGTRIAPDLYIACGISGAVQHMVGCKSSKKILAINTDENAPIIAKADYAVIGDLHEIVPALIEALRDR